MGLIQDVAGPLSLQFISIGPLSLIALVSVSAIGLIVLLNVLHQLIFQNPNEPPLVFHLFPFIGSTITYGIDPLRFFKTNRAKVWPHSFYFCLSAHWPIAEQHGVPSCSGA